jgi:hypothetical protein
MAPRAASVEAMRGMRYVLSALAEKVCSTADRWEWSARTVGVLTQDRRTPDPDQRSG